MPDKKFRRLTEDDWTKLIEAFHASGLTQKAFSQQQDIRYDRFRHHYQRSPLFRGRRRKSMASDFTPISVSPVVEPVQGWSVHVGRAVRIDCPQPVSVEMIVRLARGLADDA